MSQIVIWNSSESRRHTEPAFASVLRAGERGDRHDEAPMSRTDCPSQDTLADFVLGKLPVPELGTVAEHLDVCPECEQKTGQLDGMADGVASELRRISGPGMGSGRRPPIWPRRDSLNASAATGSNESWARAASAWSIWPTTTN